ncbi:hypothetical protein [Anabaenopsis elenkinii]|uniref:Uncharacterized protein n=1 Tax=Anabaenopsis elenkinii CCIBt3563 TaxID=2779889 RepID=A0A7S6RD72_9CYAN|nr:hypothetical protein [Anabaenopsis elenkinii]QOV22097.1 hypothetical protein IM676_15560 [Anabaenopsis elenkinii CCIBt3563]
MEVSKLTIDSNKSQQETIIPRKITHINRREFMKLPLEERRRILAEQAELMLMHYQHNQEWQELQTGDLIDY